MASFLDSLLRGGKRNSSLPVGHAARQKRLVYEGRLSKTSGGLTKKDLIKNKRGQIVSKWKSEISKERMSKLKKQGKWAPPINSAAWKAKYGK